MIREICFFAVIMICVGLYVAWRERRVRRSLQGTTGANVHPKESPVFGTVMQLAVGSEVRMLPPPESHRSLSDQRLLSQVDQLLALRG